MRIYQFWNPLVRVDFEKGVSLFDDTKKIVTQLSFPHNAGIYTFNHLTK